MTSMGWRAVAGVAQLLYSRDREAVLGDLRESGEGAWRGLLDVLGLVIRRQAAPWRDWRPWLAGPGLCLPASLPLMGLSVAVSQGGFQLVGREFAHSNTPALYPAGWLLLCQLVVLIGCSWSSGFAAAAISRRTLRISILLCCLPCCFCLLRFHIVSLSRECLLLFMVPALWGMQRGLRVPRIRLELALAIAVAVTASLLIAWSVEGGFWWNPARLLNVALLWPTWYLIAAAGKREPDRVPA